MPIGVMAWHSRAKRLEGRTIPSGQAQARPDDAGIGGFPYLEIFLSFRTLPSDAEDDSLTSRLPLRRPPSPRAICDVAYRQTTSSSISPVQYH